MKTRTPEAIALLKEITALSPDEAIEQLTFIQRGTSPVRPLAAAIAWKDEITPRLLAEAALTPKEVEARYRAEPDKGTAYYLHTFALYLLGLFEEPRAWPLILDYFTTDPELADELAGDLTTEHLAPILVRCYDGGGLERLKTIIETPSFDPFLRDACLKALHGLVLTGRMERDEFVAYADRVLDAPEDETESLWNALVVCAVLDFDEPSLRPKVEALFDRGLVDTSFVGKSELDSPHAHGMERTREEILGETFFDNFIDEASQWWWFVSKGDAAEKPDPAEAAWYTRHLDTPYVRAEPKVGRNDPCPCGSGKKYKKCCLAADP